MKIATFVTPRTWLMIAGYAAVALCSLEARPAAAGTRLGVQALGLENWTAADATKLKEILDATPSDQSLEVHSMPFTFRPRVADPEYFPRLNVVVEGVGDDHDLQVTLSLWFNFKDTCNEYNPAGDPVCWNWNAFTDTNMSNDCSSCETMLKRFYVEYDRRATRVNAYLTTRFPTLNPTERVSVAIVPVLEDQATSKRRYNNLLSFLSQRITASGVTFRRSYVPGGSTISYRPDDVPRELHGLWSAVKGRLNDEYGDAYSNDGTWVYLDKATFPKHFEDPSASTCVTTRSFANFQFDKSQATSTAVHTLFWRPRYNGLGADCTKTKPPKDRKNLTPLTGSTHGAAEQRALRLFLGLQ